MPTEGYFIRHHDADRMARFEREAQVLASLNHSNIATLHGLEESGSTRALVMELVEDPTLAERIARDRPRPSRPRRAAREFREARVLCLHLARDPSRSFGEQNSNTLH